MIYWREGKSKKMMKTVILHLLRMKNPKWQKHQQDGVEQTQISETKAAEIRQPVNDNIDCINIDEGHAGH